MWDAPNETVWNTLLHTFRSSRRSKYREDAGLMDPTPNIGERWLRCLWVIAFLRGAEFRNGYINASIGKIGIANKEQARVNDANAALVGP